METYLIVAILAGVLIYFLFFRTRQGEKKLVRESERPPSARPAPGAAAKPQPRELPERKVVEEALRKYRELRQPRTSMVQAEARKNGLRYDSKYADLAQRDKEIANSAQFRRSLYDYDIEKEALEFVRTEGAAA